MQRQLQTLQEWLPVAAYDGVFDAEECQRILTLGTDFRQAGAAGPRDTSVRSSRIQWLKPDGANAWLFEKLAQQVQAVNAKHFRMELAGFTEPLQITRYGEGDFYGWHIDFGNGRNSIRKLSLIVQLTDEDDYEGGAVELLSGHKEIVLPRARGTMCIFPSYLLHRVQPVLRGTRMSLVGWIGGNHLR